MNEKSDTLGAELFELWRAGAVTMPKVAAHYYTVSRLLHNTSWKEAAAFTRSEDVLVPTDKPEDMVTGKETDYRRTDVPGLPSSTQEMVMGEDDYAKYKWAQQNAPKDFWAKNLPVKPDPGKQLVPSEWGSREALSPVFPHWQRFRDTVQTMMVEHGNNIKAAGDALVQASRDYAATDSAASELLDKQIADNLGGGSSIDQPPGELPVPKLPNDRHDTAMVDNPHPNPFLRGKDAKVEVVLP